MSIKQSELNKELNYLTIVKKELNSIINQNKKNINYRKKDINESKKFMWERLNEYTDEERANALYEMDHSVDLTNKQISFISKYEKALSTPYFGKIVFKNNNEKMNVYLGITSIQNKSNFFVFDWRAPISSMFYNYELGKAKYDSPNGEVSGEITSKMQFKIVDGNLIRCFQSDINIDDEYLQEILATSSTDKMKNIVSTIQREQNEIIRNDKDKYLIVQGIAGSGKTSVALHRIAYLIYRDLSLNSNNILIFSPNDVFSDYISNVLPELGEENVLKSTFSEFASAYLKPYKNIESYSEFLERVYSLDKEKDISYKMSNKYEKDLIAFINNYEKTILFEKEIVSKNKSVKVNELNALFHVYYKKFSFKEKIDLMSVKVCNLLSLPRKKYTNIIKKHLIESCKIEFNFLKLYKEFLKYVNIVCENNGRKNKIYYEDIIGLLYLKFQINGYPNYNNIKQVIIDEAQDYSKFQIKLLKKVFKNASFTILGDINQSINPYYKYDSFFDITTLFDKSKYIELSKTYRSTEEIIDYSNKILEINNACSVRKSSNVPVTLKNVSEKEVSLIIKKDIEEMKKLKIRKIAIITRNVTQAKKLSKLLEEMKNLNTQLISSSNCVINNDIVVIPSYLSKGLEFDGVIVYNDLKNEYKENEKHLYYVVCTRAQHKLYIYNEPKIFFK